MRSASGVLLGAICASALIVSGCSCDRLRAPAEGELFLSGKVASGPGGDCWLLQADNGYVYNFVGESLGDLKTVGGRAEMIVRPEPDRESTCGQGRVVTVLDFRVTERANFKAKKTS